MQLYQDLIEVNKILNLEDDTYMYGNFGNSEIDKIFLITIRIVASRIVVL